MSEQGTSGQAEQALGNLPWLTKAVYKRLRTTDHPSVAKAVTPEPRDTENPEEARYMRSYLWMRIFIGVLGIALPLVLVPVGWGLDRGNLPRDSLSEYYYSGAREVFVGGVAAIAVFLIAYKIAEAWSWDFVLSLVAGLAAIVVVVFPTGKPKGFSEVTAVQRWVTETWAGRIHFGGAFVFIGLLAVISLIFAIQEGAREPEPGEKRSPSFWMNWHAVLATAIAMAALTLVFLKVTDRGFRTYVFWGECIAIVAFAVSWLSMGLDRNRLRKRV
jgi:Protein of unknown function (DUF998)